MNPKIENADCMVRAVASVTQRPEVIEFLRPFRETQLNEGSSVLSVESELKNLQKLFSLIGENVSISLLRIKQIVELDLLLEQGERILIGLPKGQSSQSPHIVHIEHRYEQPQIIRGDTAQLAWKGYKSAQEYISVDSLFFTLMEQGELQLFLIR